MASKTAKPTADEFQHWSNVTADTISNALIKKDFLTPPKLFRKGHNAGEFIRNLEEFCKSVHVKENDRVFLLVNNLEDTVKYELLALPEYAANQGVYDWVKQQFVDLNGGKTQNALALVNLLQLKQNGADLRDYLSTLRVKAFQLMGQDNPGLREVYLITAFKNGLDNKDLSIIIDSNQPATVQAAFEIAQNANAQRLPISNGETNCIHAIQNSGEHGSMSDKIDSLQNEIRFLKEQVKYLITITTNNQARQRPMPAQITPSSPNPRMFRNEATSPPTPRVSRNHATSHAVARFPRNDTDVKCFNCNGFGHISRDCRKPCGKCGDRRHKSVSCNTTQHPHNYQDNANRFRLLQDEFDAEYPNLEDAVSRTSEKTEDIKVVRVGKERANKLSVRKRVTTPEENWANYIEGHGKKPSTRLQTNVNPTLITMRRPERAANKPIVTCRCETVPVKLLFDSGAECNVISTDLLQKIMKVQNKIKLSGQTSNLKCANGEIMRTCGTAWLTLEIGHLTTRHPFKVVEGIFPDIICGLRMMKGCSITIDASQDCVYVGRAKIPFMAKTLRELPELAENH